MWTWTFLAIFHAFDNVSSIWWGGPASSYLDCRRGRIVQVLGVVYSLMGDRIVDEVDVALYLSGSKGSNQKNLLWTTAKTPPKAEKGDQIDESPVPIWSV